MTVKIMAKLPKNDSDNGLAGIEAALIDALENGHSDETWFVTAIIKPKRYTLEDDGEKTPTAHVVHIEVLAGPERTTGEKLLRDRHKQRTGVETLPFEEPGDDD